MDMEQKNIHFIIKKEYTVGSITAGALVRYFKVEQEIILRSLIERE